MFDEIITATAETDTQIIQTAIGAVGTVLVALTVLIGVIVQARKPEKTVQLSTGRPETSLPPLAGWQGSLTDFLELVILRHNDLDFRHTRLEAEMEEDRRSREIFQGAVRRYLESLSVRWPGPDPMPWPHDDDFDILELNQTLPPSWVSERKSRKRE